VSSYIDYGFDDWSKIPPGVSIQDNIDRAKEFQKNHTPEETILWFYDHVRNNKDRHLSLQDSMDYKQIDPEYADFGNYNYAVVGKALGFSDSALFNLAGWAQQKSDGSGAIIALIRALSDFKNDGDNPEDHAIIKEGIAAAGSFGVSNPNDIVSAWLHSDRTLFNLLDGMNALQDGHYATYDEYGNLLSTDEVTKDLEGNLTVVHKDFDADGVTILSETETTFSRDGKTFAFKEVDASGTLVHSYVFIKDSTGAKVIYKEFGPDGTLQSESITTTSEDGKTTTILNKDGSGNTLSTDLIINDADGQQTYHTEYDVDGKKTSEYNAFTSMDGNIMYYEKKDGDGNFISCDLTTKNPDGRETTIHSEYDPNGPIVNGKGPLVSSDETTKDKDGNTWSTHKEYEANGTTKSDTFTYKNADGTYEYNETKDGQGNRISSDSVRIDPDGKITKTHIEYNPDGSIDKKTITETFPDGRKTAVGKKQQR